MLRQPIEDLRGDGFAKAKSRTRDGVLERSGRHDHDVVAAGAKGPSETDEGVDVTGRADRSHDEFHLECVDQVVIFADPRLSLRIDNSDRRPSVAALP